MKRIGDAFVPNLPHGRDVLLTLFDEPRGWESGIRCVYD